MIARGQSEVHQQRCRIGSAKVKADVSWARSSGAVGVVSWVEIRVMIVLDVAGLSRKEARVQCVEDAIRG